MEPTQEFGCRHGAVKPRLEKHFADRMQAGWQTNEDVVGHRTNLTLDVVPRRLRPDRQRPPKSTCGAGAGTTLTRSARPLFTKCCTSVQCRSGQRMGNLLALSSYQIATNSDRIKVWRRLTCGQKFQVPHSRSRWLACARLRLGRRALGVGAQLPGLWFRPLS